ncbi:MAG TPA: cytochrome c [Steroidobacteraceae bacterium]
MKLPKSGRILVGVLGSVALAVGACSLLAWREVLDPIEPPAAHDFDAASVRRGAQLAALGDCGPCHTRSQGEALAGGRPIATPFGTIFSTNITPDPQTGIGRWSRAAFRRAMREGVDREGRHLYPAFPYDHFTLVSDADDAALYAYLMTRRPIRAQAQENHLTFPMNVRWVVAAWKLWFFRQGPYQSDAAHDRQWNQGAYLANGLAHCGACHTPRNRFGAENPSQGFAGTETDGWYAYAIDSAAHARVRWDAKALNVYLHYGWHDQHGVALGPMAEVTAGLGDVPDGDRTAIAVYVASLMNPPRLPAAGKAPSGQASSGDGERIYTATCAQCHDGTRPLPFGGVQLELSTAVTGDSAINLVNVVLNGLRPSEGAAGPIMPGFASALTDTQLDALMSYLRMHFAGKAPWPAAIERVREARRRARD